MVQTFRISKREGMKMKLKAASLALVALCFASPVSAERWKQTSGYDPKDIYDSLTACLAHHSNCMAGKIGRPAVVKPVVSSARKKGSTSPGATELMYCSDGPHFTKYSRGCGGMKGYKAVWVQ